MCHIDTTVIRLIDVWTRAAAVQLALSITRWARTVRVPVWARSGPTPGQFMTRRGDEFRHALRAWARLHSPP